MAIKKLNKQQIELFFKTLSQEIVPKTELNWQTPLELIIAVVLSAQCTDKMVNKVTASLFQKYKTTEDYIKIGEEELKTQIKSIGLYKNKAKNIINLCKRVKEVYDNKIPNNLQDLCSLSGVGRKTANVVMNVLYDMPTLAVDTHIYRLANRCGFVSTKNAEATEAPLINKIPAKYLKNAHHYLILHGRYICKARKPQCYRCSVEKYCNYDKKNL